MNKMGYHIICSFVENRTGDLLLTKTKTNSLVRYYKCTLMGIILDWLESNALYDLIEFCQEFCDLFSGSGEKAFLKCRVSQDKQ